jgi:Chaperone of endosialidase
VRAGQDLTGNDNICIGSQVFGVAGENNTIRIGDNLPNQTGQSSCYIGGIFSQPVSGSGLAVFVDSNGKLGMNPSSQRFKRDIQPMDKASEAILALKPVTFHYKSDAKNMPCFGLIAEEVAQLNPDLVVRDKNGEPLTVRYEQINAMLLNEFLKEHRKLEQQDRKIQEQEAMITGLKSEMKALASTVKEQATQIHNVSAQAQMSSPAQRVVFNNQ